jgi:hypothetical protein
MSADSKNAGCKRMDAQPKTLLFENQIKPVRQRLIFFFRGQPLPRPSTTQQPNRKIKLKIVAHFSSSKTALSRVHLNHAFHHKLTIKTSRRNTLFF